MAAHPYTMLKQMRESLANATDGGVSECKMIAHAMMYAQQADMILEGLDIYDLASNKFAVILIEFIDAILSKYESIWKCLGKPITFEDWRHNWSVSQTRTRGKYNSFYRKPFSMWNYMTEDEKLNYRHVSSDAI